MDYDTNSWNHSGTFPRRSSVDLPCFVAVFRETNKSFSFASGMRPGFANDVAMARPSKRVAPAMVLLVCFDIEKNNTVTA